MLALLLQLGMYGWMHSPCVEWYVNEDSFGNLTQNARRSRDLTGAPLRRALKRATRCGEMRSPWVILALSGLVACEGRSCASPATGKNEPSSNVAAPPTCAALPIRLGGAEGFVDCVKGEPSQFEYPECYTIWFDFVPGQQRVCPPEQLLMWVTGWPRVADRYEVQLRPEPATAITALVLVRQPDGQVGPRGPAPGHPGDVLGRIKTIDGRFTEMLPNRSIRAYQRDITLARREL